MTEDELNEIRERLEDATPGPWKIDDGGVNDHIHSIGPICGYDFDSLNFKNIDDPNVQFIAHASTDISNLLDEVERLREEIKRLEGELELMGKLSHIQIRKFHNKLEVR
jgi:hypothetical protein